MSNSSCGCVRAGACVPARACLYLCLFLGVCVSVSFCVCVCVARICTHALVHVLLAARTCTRTRIIIANDANSRNCPVAKLTRAHNPSATYYACIVRSADVAIGQGNQPYLPFLRFGRTDLHMLRASDSGGCAWQ